MEKLTPRQDEVLRLMARGLTNGQIAERMGVTLAGAKWHVSEVLSKLGAASREEAVTLWQAEHGAGSRLRAIAGALVGTKAIVTGAAATGVAGVFLVATLVLGGSGGGGEEPERAVASTGDVFTPDGQGRYVYPGNCESWPVTVNYIPSCGPLADDEVRFVIDFVGARVAINGLAGAGVERVSLEFADGTIVETVTGPLVADANDSGAFFDLEGTYASPPQQMSWSTWDYEPMGGADIFVIPETSSWRTATPAPPAAGLAFEQTVIRGCATWRFAGNRFDDCVSASPITTGLRGSTSESSGNFFRGIAAEDTERIVLGFDDGTLREAFLTESLTADARTYYAFGLVTETGRTALTLTAISSNGTVTVTDEDRTLRLPDLREGGDRLQFGDALIAIFADADGCYSFAEVSELKVEPRNFLGGSCALGIEMRNPDDNPVLLVGMHPSARLWLTIHVLLNPQADVVEVVDEAGNVYREKAQTIPSSPQGLKFVYFDREVAAPASDLRVLDADGKVIATEEGTLAVGRP